MVNTRYKCSESEKSGCKVEIACSKHCCAPLSGNYNVLWQAEHLQLHLFSGSHVHCAGSKLMLSGIDQGFSSTEWYSREKGRFEGNSYFETCSQKEWSKPALESGDT